jgi:crotonobetainyl-CoA:carnitine CoA-transferase CaiB-like acyl-CoA transferase
VDLSALWAGPLAGRLLALAGADVIKVESTTRPDGARLGHPDHYAALNANKRSVALNFATQQGRAALHALLRQADIVIESTRPRALRQLGIIAEDLVAARPGSVWLSITAHGRDATAENAIGFGDDAAAAAGLANLMAQTYGQMIFAGDAVADPLTGLHAALAAFAAWRQGQGGLLSLSLAGVVTTAMRLGGTLDGPALASRAERWARIAAPWADQPYTLPWPGARAAAIGADTAAVLATLAVPC